jgi:hypothetical protein
MFRPNSVVAVFAIALMISLPDVSRGIDVLSYRYDSSDNGANTQEVMLTPQNVNTKTFGLKYSVPVVGQIYAQPLIKTQVGSPARNLVFVATQQNVVMAVNTATGVPVWTNALTNFGVPVPFSDVGSMDINPVIGICSTPVIQGNYLYVTSKAKYFDDAYVPHFTYTLYKIDIRHGNVVTNNNFADTAYHATTNSTNFSYRTDIDPYVLGTGDAAVMITNGESTNGESRVYFNALREMNRAALTLVGGVIYAGFSSHGNIDPYHGWVLGFDPVTLNVVAAFNTTPDGRKGGIWQTGGKIVSDSKNNLYLEVGNGSFGATNAADLDANGFPITPNYGDSVLKLARDSSTPSNPNPNGWGLKVVDYFTPTNNAYFDTYDLDFGSCGAVLIPSGSKSYLIGTSKDGTIYSMNSTNLGKFNPSTNAIVQTIDNALGYLGYTNGTYTPAALCTPSYLGGYLYYFGTQDNGKQFALSSKGILTNWGWNAEGFVQTDAESTNAFLFPGMNSSISANGQGNVIIWGIDSAENALRAYRPIDTPLVKELRQIWNSNQSPSDSFTGALKFTIPVVANGRVYVGAENALNIFGLKPASTR